MFIFIKDALYINKPGAIPKATKSDIESNSDPKGVTALSLRALKPSRKSNIMDKNINKEDRTNSSFDE